MSFKKVIWSPVEIDYLRGNRSKPVSQLCIALAKSTHAIRKKIQELGNGKEVNLIQNKNQISKIGKRKDCNNLFFRSGWEANIYRLLKQDKSITLIEYEPYDFTFYQFGHLKGTVSYTPDFKVTYQDGSYVWIEIKGGWLRPADKTKIRRFKKYYEKEFAKLTAVTPGPKSKTAVFFVEQEVPIKWYYPDLNKKYKHIVPHWE